MRLVRLQVERPVSTDDILPARYKHMHSDPQLLAPHVFENLLPGLDLQDCALVSPALFGIGSSREQAVSALKAAGVKAVLAPAFGRIFFRNAWNLALPALERGDPGGAEWELDLSGVPEEMLEMVRYGGLLERLRRRD